MDLKEALNVLDAMCSRANGNRQEHFTVQQALKMIQKALPTEVPLEDKKET